MATAERSVARSADAPFEIRPMTPAIGAELLGVDLGSPDIGAAIPAIREALLTHKVIFFRDQDITREQHLEFAQHFGELEIHPATPKDQQHPEILRIAYDENSRGQENAWHSDVTWREEPSMGSILRAIELPAVGGDTLFACMHAAYRGLSDEMRRFVSGMIAVHDIARVFARRLGKQPQELHDKYPPVEHPVVRTHPETGLPTLYVNVAFTSHIKGLSEQESADLLRHLYAQASNPEIQCRFRWAPGSIAFWDNRAVQHFAASDYFPARRAMERATIKGDRPFYRA
ncbi:MAG: TauD/TfdA dioxygenase family protein [Parasphingopyxis sp.]|nr:TauD/TfdA family dioxygenase [Sphingomonadales bacterium]